MYERAIPREAFVGLLAIVTYGCNLLKASSSEPHHSLTATAKIVGTMEYGAILNLLTADVVSKVRVP